MDGGGSKALLGSIRNTSERLELIRHIDCRSRVLQTRAGCEEKRQSKGDDFAIHTVLLSKHIYVA
jgi:hypothetical protein